MGVVDVNPNLSPKVVAAVNAAVQEAKLASPPIRLFHHIEDMVGSEVFSESKAEVELRIHAERRKKEK